MRTRRPLVLAVVLSLGAMAAPRLARAELDPTRAAKDVDAIRAEGKDTFCSKPSRPLSTRARQLCEHAAEIPGCDGLVAACKEPGAASKDAETAPDEKKPNDPPHIPALLGELARYAVWLLVFAAIVAIAVPVVRALLRRRRDKSLSDPLPKTEKAAPAGTVSDFIAVSDAELLLRSADDHARSGKLDVALQLYLTASLRALDKRGAIRVSRDRTNGEYVRACKEEPARAPLREIVREVDRVQFGGVQATQASVSAAATRATSVVRMTATFTMAAMMLLALPFVGACDSSFGKAAPRSNPAGDEMFLDLLARQGVSATKLGGALSSLPMPVAGEPRKTVVVDVERTSLDDDTRAHLMRWVEAGGALVLAGRAAEWPKELHAEDARAASSETEVIVRARLPSLAEDDASMDGDDAVYIARARAKVVVRRATRWTPPPEVPAFFAEANANPAYGAGSDVYAGMKKIGKGVVLGVATDELFTNVGLARAGNAEAMLALIAILDPTSCEDDECVEGVNAKWKVELALPEDGVTPPSNPIAGMARAGLGLGMWHALAAAIVLFLAVGIRLARPRPEGPPKRRAFTEHLEATGALYARTHVATHALAAYTQYAEERLHARMPRGMTDIPAFLAARTNAELSTCEAVWSRAKNARVANAPRGDELDTLKQLSALYTAAST